MIFDHDKQPIIAQCTPKGLGALALIRITGEQVFQLMHPHIRLASSKNIMDISSHTIHYGKIIADNNDVIDHCMFIIMHSPQTFTGQDTLEITCHNNQFLIDNILRLAIKTGIRLAERGEFSRRAFMHGKLDALQAEAINELIHASSEYALKQSLMQLEGSFSHWICNIEKKLLHCLALSDASFEFLDEENIEFGDQIDQLLQDLLDSIKKIKISFDQQKQIRQGIRIAFIGSVNAGKSSLFNALIGFNRAIVNIQAGTTRDVIEYGIYQDGKYLTYIDTAGLRETDEQIEKEGIEKTYEQAHNADIILLIIDLSRIMTDQENLIYQDLLGKYKSKILIIGNKMDNKVDQYRINNDLEVSSKDNLNIDKLQAIMQLRINDLFTHLTATPFLLNTRQYHIMLDLERRLYEIQKRLIKPIAYEILSIHVQECLQLLMQLTGKNISDQAMDKIFKEFCVGK